MSTRCPLDVGIVQPGKPHLWHLGHDFVWAGLALGPKRCVSHQATHAVALGLDLQVALGIHQPALSPTGLARKNGSLGHKGVSLAKGGPAAQSARSCGPHVSGIAVL
jgi:hypothetical protein